MNKTDFKSKFCRILDEQGKPVGCDITIYRALEVIEQIFEEENEA